MSEPEDKNVLIVPHGTGGAPLLVDLESISASEARQEEVAFVTQAKAPELLAEFNRSWLYLSQAAARLDMHLVKAKQEVAKRRAVVLLEEAPRIMKEKGLDSNKEVRDAVIAADAEMGRLLNRVDQIEAARDFLRIKAKSFENAFTSVKAIIKTDTVMLRGGGGMPTPGNGPSWR